MFCRRAFDFDAQHPVCASRSSGRAPRWSRSFAGSASSTSGSILPVMQAILTSLGEDPHLYDRRLTGTNFGLRLNYYPPIGDRGRRDGRRPALGHEDVDLFTLAARAADRGARRS